MRLWHQDLIHYLPDHQLLGQHRECCALRGRGWGRKHSTVDYIFKYDLSHLYAYHQLVIGEMCKRNFNVDAHWYNRLYRGKYIIGTTLSDVGTKVAHKIRTAYFLDKQHFVQEYEHVYEEHNDQYLADCILNLLSKHVVFKNNFDPYAVLIKLQLSGVDTSKQSVTEVHETNRQ